MANPSDRKGHWERTHLVPRELTYYEALRLLVSLEDEGRCTWCHWKMRRLQAGRICPRCDSVRDFRSIGATDVTATP